MRELAAPLLVVLSPIATAIEISRLVGHAGTTVTETVYRHELHPVLTEGAEAMDRIRARRELGSLILYEDRLGVRKPALTWWAIRGSNQ